VFRPKNLGLNWKPFPTGSAMNGKGVAAKRPGKNPYNGKKWSTLKPKKLAADLKKKWIEAIVGEKKETSPSVVKSSRKVTIQRAIANGGSFPKS